MLLQKSSSSKVHPVKGKKINEKLTKSSKVRENLIERKKVKNGYVTVTKNPRYMSSRCDRKRKKYATISDQDRQQIFDSFWKLDWDQKKMYVSSLVQIYNKVKSTTKTLVSRRNKSYKYFLKVKHITVSVCQTTFLSTLGIGSWSVH